MRALTWLFGAPEEINGGERCPTYMYRWTVLSTRLLKIYLHHFVGDDWSRDLHDHPKRFLSIGLWGHYVEHTPLATRTWRAPWIRSFPAEHIHRITVPSKSCWTLVLVGAPVREWGFWVDAREGQTVGRFIPWHIYIKSTAADKAKACD